MTTRGREQTQFARQLSSLRWKAHLSRERLADLSEVSIHSVHSWEQGRAANPTLRKVCRLAQALGVPIWYCNTRIVIPLRFAPRSCLLNEMGVLVVALRCLEKRKGDRFVCLQRISGDPGNPFKEPDRRHRRCQYLLEYSRWPSPTLDDDTIRDYWRFLRDLRRFPGHMNRERLTQQYPGIALAHRFFIQASPLKRAEREARLLARQSDDVIAEKCSLTAAAVGAFHDLFYEVRPFLQAEAYILNIALGPKVHQGLRSDDHELLLKLTGYTMGPWP
jgi:transcriptional regulator with XRE-family HTH domain